MPHHCHAFGCKNTVSPKKLMCLKHWRMVPAAIQKAVWATYVPGQETRKDPTRVYLLAQRAAVWCVFVEEGGCTWPDVPELGSEHYLLGPEIYGDSLRKVPQ